MTTVSISRVPTPLGSTTSRSGEYRAEHVYLYESTGRTSSKRLREGKGSAIRHVDTKTRDRADWYVESPPSPLVHIGWVDLASRPLAAIVREAGREPQSLLTLEKEHSRWHDGRTTVLRVGAVPPLRDHVLPLLLDLSGSPGWGDKVDWSKGRLELVTKTITADEVRIEVRASTEHPSFGRIAHYELSGELTLMVPSGWPTRFVSAGSWKLPIPTLAGDTTIEGTFHRTLAWTYTPNASAPLPTSPGPAPAP
jgi:hypothetical protein